MLDIKKNSKQKVDIEEGQYLGSPVMIVDLGQQFQTDWQTGEVQTWDDGNPKIQNEVFISFSLLTKPYVSEEGDEGFVRVGKTFTVSAHEKAAIVGLMKAAGCKSTEITELVNKPVMVDVGHTATGNPKIRGFSKASAKILVEDDVISVASLVQKAPKCIVYDRDDHNEEVFESLPDFLKQKITEQASRIKYLEMKEDNKPAKTQRKTKEQEDKEAEEILDDVIPY